MTQQAYHPQVANLLNQVLSVVGLLLLGTPPVLGRVPLLAVITAGVTQTERTIERGGIHGRD